MDSIKTAQFTKKEPNELAIQLDTSRPGNLSGCFDISLLDEAHELKSLRAKATCAVSWFDADFHVMINATPIPNGVYDFGQLRDQPVRGTSYEPSTC